MCAKIIIATTTTMETETITTATCSHVLICFLFNTQIDQYNIANQKMLNNTEDKRNLEPCIILTTLTKSIRISNTKLNISQYLRSVLIFCFILVNYNKKPSYALSRRAIFLFLLKCFTFPRKLRVSCSLFHAMTLTSRFKNFIN